MATPRRSRRDDDVVDLRGVEAGSGRRSAHLPVEDGPYKFEVAAVKVAEGKDSGKKYLDVQARVVAGPYKGKKVYHSCSLQPKALFNLKNLMQACGVEAERAFKIPVLIKTLTGKKFTAEVEDDEWNDKVKSVISEFILDAPAKKSRRARDEEDEDEEEEEDEEEDEEEEDEEDEEEDDEDEEEEEPVKTRKARSTSKTTAKTKTKAKAPSRSRGRRRAADDEDEDDEDLDDIELDDL